MKINSPMKNREFHQMGFSQQKDVRTEDVQSFRDTIRAKRKSGKHRHRPQRPHEKIDDISKELAKINDHLKKILDLLNSILEKKHSNVFPKTTNTHKHISPTHLRDVNKASNDDTDHAHSDNSDDVKHRAADGPSKEKSSSEQNNNANRGRVDHDKSPFAGTIWDVDAIPDNAPSKTLDVRAVDKNGDGEADKESVKFYDRDQKKYITEKLYAYDVSISDGNGKEKNIRIHLAEMEDMSESQRLEIAKNYGDVLGKMPAQLLSGERKDTDKIVVRNGDTRATGGDHGIVLRTSVSQNKLDDLMLHELAHAWDASRKQGDKWFSDQEQWQNAMKKDGGPAISTYAETAVKEDFAETLSVYYSLKNGLLDNSSVIEERYKNRFQVLESLGF